MEKRNITIDDLAIMVKKGFDGTAKKEQVDNIEKQVENLEKWTKRRFDNIDRELKSCLSEVGFD